MTTYSPVARPAGTDEFLLQEHVTGPDDEDDEDEDSNVALLAAQEMV